MEKVGDPAANLLSPSISPDRGRVAVHRTVKGNADIWLLDVRRGVLSRFTSSEEPEFYPVWSPDAKYLAFTSAGDLYRASASGVAPPEALLKSPEAKSPSDWSLDGRFLLYYTAEPNPSTPGAVLGLNVRDIWALPLEGERKPFPLVQTTFNERNGQFSPDGKWVAYQSDESGRTEVYVQAFPGPGGRSQISSNGGAMARWRRDGKELFYVALDDRLMAVPIEIGSNSVEAGTPAPLFLTRVGGGQQVYGPQYVVSPDGQRFLMNTIAEEIVSPITVVVDWKPKP